MTPHEFDRLCESMNVTVHLGDDGMGRLHLTCTAPDGYEFIDSESFTMTCSNYGDPDVLREEMSHRLMKGVQ